MRLHKNEQISWGASDSWHRDRAAGAVLRQASPAVIIPKNSHGIVPRPQVLPLLISFSPLPFTASPHVTVFLENEFYSSGEDASRDECLIALSGKS